ncbi:hypothetical protein GCM10027586_06210 [Kineococcus gypseus]
MPARSQEMRSRIAKTAAVSRWSPAEAATARRDLRALRAEEYISALVAQAPPLTAEQRDRLVLLLRPANDRGAVA